MKVSTESIKEALDSLDTDEENSSELYFAVDDTIRAVLDYLDKWPGILAQCPPSVLILMGIRVGIEAVSREQFKEITGRSE